MQEEIPNIIYWPRGEYRAGLSNSSIYELNELIEKTITQEWINNRREEILQSNLWKKLPKNEEKANALKKKNRSIANKQVKWLMEEEKLKIKCNFLEINYIEPHPFPTHYETYSEKKMKFLLNYYWCENRETQYCHTWDLWTYKDESRRNKLDRNISTAKKIYIEKLIHDRWVKIPQEIRDEAIAKFNEAKKRLHQRASMADPSRGFRIESGNEMRAASNGMCIERTPNMTQDDWNDKIADLKQALRDV